MINTPVALFYLQGLNTTAVHAHAELFGVYGFLALGFTLLVLRYIRPAIAFNERLMRLGFWGLNAGLVLMIFTSLLPVGDRERVVWGQRVLVSVDLEGRP